MNRPTVWLMAWLTLQGSGDSQAQTLSWFSDANATNLTSSGAPMDAGFIFELGVFSGGFEPSAGSAALWLQFWSPAQSASYNASNNLFTGSFAISDNSPPFVAGAKAWIFGRRASATGSEWILCRASDWVWPEASNDPFQIGINWNAKDATEVVLGTIHPSGSPFLMQSAAVQSYAQWQATDLTEEPLDDPDDDPDLDGSSNLLEFVFGTDPGTANAPVATPVALQSSHAVITIPRGIDHLAILTVEVSGNLTDWNPVTDSTNILQDDAAALVVRDPIPLGPANPRRFIRLKASLP